MDKSIPMEMRLRAAPWHNALDALQTSTSVVARHWDALTDVRRNELTAQASYWRAELERQSLALLNSALNQQSRAMHDVLSHSVRTPLTVVSAAAVTLAERSGRLSVTRRCELVTRLNHHLHRLDAVLGALAEVAMVHDEYGLQPRLVDVAALIHRAADLAGLRERALHVSAHNLAAWVDPGVVIRALRRLFDNIAVHTPANTRTWVAAWRHDRRLHIRVEDDGPGMPAPLVTPLSSTPAMISSDNPSPRPGLGLALTAAYAQLHGGTASHAPSPRGGAAIKVSFAEQHESG